MLFVSGCQLPYMACGHKSGTGACGLFAASPHHQTTPTQH